MSMLPCRVLCLLVIVLCCVGVAHAAATPGVSSLFVQAEEKAKEILKQKEECVIAGKAARKVADEAQQFVVDTKKKLETIAAHPEEVEKTKSKGHELIDKARKAAAEARKVVEVTTAIVEETYDKAGQGLLRGNAEVAEEAAKEADEAKRDAITDIEAAELHAELVEGVLKDLDAAVAAAAKKKEEKQVESQPHPQTKETSLGEQQGHTEGNKAEQTQEKQKEKQKQHYRSTVTINIHGDNLDAL
ncbi:uncharacterized protein TM35_000771070, partial [Trypanosoma theileri]